MAEPNTTDSFFKNFTQQLLRLSQDLLVTEKRQIQAEIKQIHDKLPEWENRVIDSKRALESRQSLLSVFKEKLANTLIYRDNPDCGISSDKRYDENKNIRTEEDGCLIPLKSLTNEQLKMAFDREITQKAELSKIQRIYDVYSKRIAKAKTRLAELEEQLETVNERLAQYSKGSSYEERFSSYELIVDEGSASSKLVF